MTFGVEIILVFVAGACLFGVAAMSVKSRQRTLSRRNALKEKRKFREQNAALSQRWN